MFSFGVFLSVRRTIGRLARALTKPFPSQSINSGPLPARKNFNNGSLPVGVFGCNRDSDDDSIARLEARHAPPPCLRFLTLELPNSIAENVGESRITM
ncbi:MAG: hypothetical protein C5B58_10330 [Acidobacteria bacterium]|nr:MAG: hypothetical protein C5B58_10330 [Acidobacteriota bacterium]